VAGARSAFCAGVKAGASVAVTLIPSSSVSVSAKLAVLSPYAQLVRDFAVVINMQVARTLRLFPPRGWLEDADDAQFAELTNEDGGRIAELLPELSVRLPESVAPPSAGDPDQARFRLFDAITRFWQRVARRRPLVWILDDLHWADTASLKLLELLARDMASSPLLLLGGFRHLDLNRRHPLSDTLAALSRLRQCQGLALRGMSRDATEALVGTLAGTVSGTAAGARYVSLECSQLSARVI
jgi:predicted ATPase